MVGPTSSQWWATRTTRKHLFGAVSPLLRGDDREVVQVRVLLLPPNGDSQLGVVSRLENGEGVTAVQVRVRVVSAKVPYPRG